MKSRLIWISISGVVGKKFETQLGINNKYQKNKKNTLVASVVEWSVCSTAVREGTGSIQSSANVVIPVFPPKATCPLSSDQYLLY